MRRLRQPLVKLWMRQPVGLSGILLTVLSIAASYIAPGAGMALLMLLLFGALLHILIGDFMLARAARAIGAERSFPLIRAVHKRGLQLVEANRSVSQRLAQRHGLSGLPTRELLIIAMNAEVGILGIVEFVDFDRLTATNPDRADQALNEIARRIVRMVGSQRMVAHVDRARFAIWFDGATEEDASGALQAIAYALQGRISIDSDDLLPIIRIGHIPFDPATAASEKVLSRAFAILANQRKGMAGSLENASTSIRGDFEMEQDLRRAIAAGEFELWFQPFIDARRQVVCGAEALIRWRHPARGFVSPAQFIPVVEASGLSDEVGVWVLDTACRAARGWSATGLHDVKVAVNVSGHQLERPFLGQSVARTLARHNLHPGLLELELTETVAAIDSRAAADLLASLRALGASISIDDFGTGFSSLSYLKNLSFDKLKIDREFVTDVDTRRDSQAICQSIIALGRGLGIAVLAEGIERPEEMAWLRDHGCHLYQGFYFSRPLPEAEFVAFARDREIIGRLLAAPISDIMRRKSA